MTGDNQPSAWSTSNQGHVWAIVKGAQGSTFWMGTHLHGGARQNRLHHCQIQERIVTTAPDDAHTRVQDVSEHSGVAIQAIQTHQDLGEEKLVRRRIAGDHLESPFQFCAVVAIARSPKRAQELMGMRLQKRGAGAHHFPSLAPLVPRSRDLIKTTMRRGQRWELGKGSLASRLFGAIDIHDHILLVEPIPQAADRGERGSRHQICLKERAQSLYGRLIQGCQKPRKGRPRGEELAAKEGHEWFGKGQQSRIKCFEGRFATESIPDQHDHEINGIVVTKTRSGKLHVILDGFQKAGVLEHLSHHRHFLEYIIMPLSLIVWLVEAIREAVSHLLLSSIPSRASFWPAALQ